MKKRVLTPIIATFALIAHPALQAEELADYVGFIPAGPAITAEDVTAAQEMWGSAVVAIGEAGDNAAAILTEQTARSDGDSALASDILALQA